MGSVYEFHGGIHPPENKRQSNGAPISAAPIPDRLVLPFNQHIGAPADAVVEIGQRVLKGQVIAEAIGRISVNIHAPTSGVVSDIGRYAVPHASGMEAPCIIIEPDGKDEWTERRRLEDFRSLNKADLTDHIRAHGIAGMGGAGFPTDVKLHLGDDHIVNTLVINAAECEPYITADDMLMRERAEQIIGGIEVIAHLLKPSHILIGIEDNKPQAIRALEEAKRGNALNIDVVVVPTKYPSGGEKQLIKLLTGVEVPSGKIPADVGIVCQNVGTASAVYRAVHHGEPLISRIVTVTGDAVDRRHNLEVLIGTPFRALLDHSGVRRKEMYRMVMGGPMMGFAMTNEEVPVVKTTNCIIAASIDEMPPAPPANPCIRCGMCEQVCPAELLPQQLHWFAKAKEFDKAKHHNLFDCIECGACSYVCPSNIELVQYYRFAKAEIRTEEAEQRKADHARERFEARKARQEAEEAEKQARRKARAEEAAKAQAVKKDAVERKETAKADAGADVKALKTAAAVARTKLKKVEKALQQAQESGADNLAELEAEFKAAQDKASTAQQKLEQAEKGQLGAAAVPDTKALKTAAAVARTKLKKAQTALKAAEEKGQDGVEALRDTVKQLQDKADAAQKAYDDAQSGAAAPVAAPALDIKQLKTNAAVARTKLKKAEKQLAAAEESGEGDLAELKTQVEQLTAKAAVAQQAYDNAESGASGAAAGAPAVSEAELAGLKEEMEKALAKVEKAQAAATAAAEKGLPTADKMKAGVDKLRGKYEESKLAFETAQQSVGGNQHSNLNIEELKSDMDAAFAKVQKAEAAATAAEAKGLPAAEKMRAGVAKLQGKYEEAKQAFEAAQQQSAGATSSAMSPAQLAELKADMEAALGKVQKAEAAAKAAAEKGLPTAEKMQAGVEKLRARYQDAKQAYEVAAGPALNGSEAAPVDAPVDMKALKQQVSIMRTKLRKVEKALEEAEAEGGDLSALQAEMAELSQRHDAAKAEFDAAEARQIELAASEGVDLKKLKVDAALARAEVTKAERAISKVTDEDSDELSQLKASLQTAQQRADELNATLSRFTD